MSEAPLTLSLSQAAFDVLMGQSRSVIVAAEDSDTGQSLVGPQVCVLGVTADGFVSQAGEDLGEGTPRYPLLGVPAGLIGVVLPKSFLSVVRALKAALRRDGVLSWPHFLELDPTDGNLLSLEGSLARVLALGLSDRDTYGARQEALLVAARTDNEALHMEVARLKAHSHTVAGARYLAASLPLGEGTAGPGGDRFKGDCLRQRMPADAAGLAMVRVHLPVEARGLLRIDVRRVGDDALLAQAQTQLTGAIPGWLGVEFNPVVAESGEVDLLIYFVAVEGGPPSGALSLSASRADRAELEGGSGSLALQVIKSPAFMPAAQLPSVLSRLKVTQKPIAAAAKGHGYLGGTAAQDAAQAILGGNPILIDQESGFVQTHPVAGAPHPVGLVLPSAFPAQCSRMALTVKLDHPAAFPVTAAAMVLTAEAAQGDGALEAMSAFLSGDASDGEWCQKTVLRAGDTAVVQLDGQQVTGPGAVLVLAAAPVGERADYGLCRWIDISVETEPGEAVLLPHAPVRDEAPSPILSPLDIWDLGRRLSFIEGHAAHEQLSLVLGYSPLSLHGERGYLQVHPLADRMSAGLVPTMLTRDIRSIGMEVLTAQKGAPDFIYIIIAVPVSCEDIGAVCRALYTELTLGAGEVRIDVTPSGLAYTAERVAAAVPTAITLDLPDDGEDRHLVLATRPIDGNTSYGWCRFSKLVLHYSSGHEGERG